MASTLTSRLAGLRFVPDQKAVTVHLGEQKLVYFTAENLSNQSIVGHATFNVTPLRSGIYFNKIQCFCFTEERLDAHQKVNMPVVFYATGVRKGPRHERHRAAYARVHLLPFRRSTECQGPVAFLASNPPDPVDGRNLFNEQCVACHALDTNKFGPALGGVFGRRAGAAPGYDYSPALKSAHLTWSVDRFEPLACGPGKIHSRGENAG